MTSTIQKAQQSIKNNTLYGALTDCQLIEFHQVNSPDPYNLIFNLQIIRMLDFFDTNHPNKCLFSLEIPYVIELNIEDDLDLIAPDLELESFWYSVQEVSSNIRLYDTNKIEIELDDTPSNDISVIDCSKRDVWHQLCHNSVFAESNFDGDPKYRFKEKCLGTGQLNYISKIEFDQNIALDLRAIVQSIAICNA